MLQNVNTNKLPESPPAFISRQELILSLLTGWAYIFIYISDDLLTYEVAQQGWSDCCGPARLHYPACTIDMSISPQSCLFHRMKLEVGHILRISQEGDDKFMAFDTFDYYISSVYIKGFCLTGLRTLVN